MDIFDRLNAGNKLRFIVHFDDGTKIERNTDNNVATEVINNWNISYTQTNNSVYLTVVSTNVTTTDHTIKPFSVMVYNLNKLLYLNDVLKIDIDHMEKYMVYEDNLRKLCFP